MEKEQDSPIEEGASPPARATIAPRAGSLLPVAPPAPPRPPLSARILPNVFAGGISGLLIVSFGISLAALIFSGDLAIYLPAGIGIVLASSCVIGLLVSLQSSFKPVVAAPQESTSVILALMAATIGHHIEPGAALPTLVVAIALTSVATGLLFLGLGLFRLGKIVRFIPYPVVGGFLAGTGWLLVQGSLSVMSDINVTFGSLLELFAGAALVKWLPGLFFGLGLTAVLRRWHHFLLLPALLLGGIGVFYAAVVISGVGVAGAMDHGWLLGPFHSGIAWPPIRPAALSQVDWGALGAGAGNIISATVLAGISILLNATGLELATDEDLDLDRELRGTGIANVVAGLFGGVPGYLLLSESTLNHKAGARSRAAGLIAAGLCAITLVAGTAGIAYFPKPVLGGLLLFMGVSFLVETVYDAYFRLPRGEYALVLVILFVVVTLGFLSGVAVGIVVSSALFALNYARIDVVKHDVSGAVLRSKAARSPEDEAILQQLGAQVHVFQLQGYLFFGTAFQLLQRVLQRLQRRKPMAAAFVVLDFRHVDGIDSSAVVSFSRMRKLAESHGATLVLTGLPANVNKQLELGKYIEDAAARGPSGGIFPDLDHGLEWCEGRIVESVGDSRPSAEFLAREFESILHRPDLVTQLLGYLERLELSTGDALFRIGDGADDLYLIESGEVEAWLELDGRTKRLRTMRGGDVVGESGLYLGKSRSASVRATQPTTLYRLSTKALDRMTAEEPRLAAAFHEFVVRVLASRMVNTTSAAQMLFFG